ncbi:hypothetical protein EON65_41875 [archaeon]|nr:MAG: hypothetical protein EON65_41875 [archaeon]
MQNLEILALAGLRIDGRKANEIRHIEHRIGVLQGVDGSAYLEHGLNKVIVSIQGPQEPKKKSNDISAEQVRCIFYIAYLITIIPCFYLILISAISSAKSPKHLLLVQNANNANLVIAECMRSNRW